MSTPAPQPPPSPDKPAPSSTPSSAQPVAPASPPAKPATAGTEPRATSAPANSQPVATAAPAPAPTPVAPASVPAKTTTPAPSPLTAKPTAAAPAAAPARAVISTRELVKTYGHRNVVAGVNIRVAAGEIVGLLGPNGAGKTTTFYMIVGLVPATRGQVLLDDRPITKLRMHQRARNGLGYLPQEPSIFRTLTVEENVRAIVETLDLPRRLHAARTKEHLDELGLWHLAKQRAYTLSGGERRRLEIARALVTRPKFLLMDEPFGGVDPISVADVQKIILDLKKRGIGILITDHSVRETLRIVDRAYLIHQGRVLTEGTGDFLINDPQAREFYLGENFDL